MAARPASSVSTVWQASQELPNLNSFMTYTTATLVLLVVWPRLMKCTAISFCAPF